MAGVDQDFESGMMKLHLPPRYTSNPIDDVVDPTGVVLGPIPEGIHRLYSAVDCYFLQGSSSIAVGDVKVDEATPDISNPINGGDYLQIEVTGAIDNYIAMKSVAAGPSGPVAVIS